MHPENMDLYRRKVQTPHTKPDILPETLASIGSRIGAGLVDLLAAYVITLLTSSIVLMTNSDIRDSSLRLMGLLIFLVYFSILEARNGQTLGKRVMGIQVVDKSGYEISIGQSLVRNSLRIIDQGLWFIPGLVSIGLSRHCQRIGDRAAGTIVVKKHNHGS